MNNILQLVSACAVAVLLSACGAADKNMETDNGQSGVRQPVQAGSNSGVNTGVASGNNVSGSETQEPELLKNEMGIVIDEFGVPTHTVFYFDYDRASIHPEDINTLASHGQYIASSPSATVRLEGHTDERGTREYNIALGENRAKSVERILQLQGVRPSQISVISFGEEQAQDFGHDDNSWALNRRVEIVYESR